MYFSLVKIIVQVLKKKKKFKKVEIQALIRPLFFFFFQVIGKIFKAYELIN